MQASNTDKPFSFSTTTFLSGPAGAGKTTRAGEHLRGLLAAGVPGDSILVMCPQRSLLQPYQDALHRADLPPGSAVETLTLGGLARRMVELFWPAVAAPGGFARPHDPPIFLTLETAQYYVQHVVEPLVKEAGYFDGVRIQPNRIYSQILDNLNKAAIVGFSYLEIGQRLTAAWNGPSGRATVFNQVQDCAARFRTFCLQSNLLDFSLQVETLTQHLLTADWFRAYLFGRYRHLIVDNVEEDPPVAHDLVRDWLGQCASALLVYDTDAGFRRFLGADPDGGWMLRQACREHIELTTSHVTSPGLDVLAAEMGAALSRHLGQRATHLPGASLIDIRKVLGYGGGRFHPQMLDWVTDEIARLVNEQGVAPGEIVVLAPYLSDALRFALSDRLERAGVPVRSLRPSRALNEEPAARCLLTLAALAHPDWNVTPPQPDVAHALTLAIDHLDPARAHLLAQRAYRPDGFPKPVRSVPLHSFDALAAELQDRIGYDFGERYEALRAWLKDSLNMPDVPLDHFLSRLFGEVLSQPGYAFHRNLDSGRVAAALVASARKFRQVVNPHPNPPPHVGEGREGVAPRPSGEEAGVRVARAYFDMVQSGIIAAEYGPSPHPPPTPSLSQPFDSAQGEEREGARGRVRANAVLLAPAYTFLLSNQPVEVQFWLNAGSPGWWERLLQPLTHPYVLTRSWPADRQWTDQDEQSARVETLRRLTLGLVRRCRRKVYLAFSTLNEQGFEERGPLLMITQQVLRQLSVETSRQ